MPDCSGPGEGHEQFSHEDLVKRRAAFRECIEGAVKEFVRILDLMSVSENMNARIYGRPLRYWLRGGDMPDPVTLPVQVEMTAAGKLLKPCQAELAVYARGGFLPPGVLVERKKAVGKRVSTTNAAKDTRDREDGLADVSDGRGAGESGRAMARKVVAGFGRAAVRNRGDRKDIRMEVQRLMKTGIPQTEACQQVADQAMHGRAGQRQLTMKYDLSPNLASGSVVRRVLVSDW